MPPLRRPAFLAAAVLLGAVACYRDPNRQLDEMQATIDLQSTLDDIANRASDLQFQVDSLRGIVARQDTAIARLANLAGVPYPR